jgi:glycosidase
MAFVHDVLRLTCLPALALLCAGFSAAGCGDDGLTSRPNPNTPSSQGETGCQPAGTPCEVVFTHPLIWPPPTSMQLMGDFAADGWTVGAPMQLEGVRWRTELSLPDGTVVRYKFLVNGTDWLTDPNNPNTEPDGVGGVNSVLTVQCPFAVCPYTEPPPPVGSFDWRSAVMYFVFVDRFRNGNPANDYAVPGVETQANFQGGDWAGVVQKIEEGYFEGLGVNTLWLTVPMNNTNASGMGTDGHLYSAYHGYWPTDLAATEEHFGASKAELKALVDKAHERGLKVLFDYAMNHVYQDAPVFANNPDWFWPLDYGGVPCVCGEGCDWNDTYEQKRCWFRDYLPDWNFTVQAARDYSVGNAVQWIVDTGCDGYRLDAVKHIETQWIRDLRQRVTTAIEPGSGEHFYMVGETFESGNRDIIKSYVGTDLLDGQFDFPLRAVLVETILRRSGSMVDVDSFLNTNDDYYPGIMSTFIGNHDIARVIHNALDQPWGAWDKGDPWLAPPALPDYASPFQRLAVAFTLLFTTKGIPLVYYGDEIGMPGAGDPDNRRMMTWEDEGAVLSEYQKTLRSHLEKLGAIRRDHPALWRGARSTLWVSNDTYAYKLSDENETVYVALNRGDAIAAVSGMPAKGSDLLTGAKVDGPNVNLQARSAIIVIAE